METILLSKAISRKGDVIRVDFDNAVESSDVDYLTEMYEKGYTDIRDGVEQYQTLIPSEHGCDDPKEMFAHLLGLI